jgi:carbonic anhydrase/acetyltransferase-like protein (isoleucine patch superfamily)
MVGLRSIGHRSMVWLWSMVDRSRSMVGLGSMVGRGSMVGLGGMVGFGSVVWLESMDYRGMVGLRSMVGGWGMDNRGMVGLRSMVWRGGMVGLRVVGEGGRGVDPNNGLLKGAVAVDRVGGGGGLAGDVGVDGAMGLVYRHVDCRSITKLDRLLVGLVSQHHGSTQQPTENGGLEQNEYEVV